MQMFHHVGIAFCPNFLSCLHDFILFIYICNPNLKHSSDACMKFQAFSILSPSLFTGKESEQGRQELWKNKMVKNKYVFLLFIYSLLCESMPRKS